MAVQGNGIAVNIPDLANRLVTLTLAEAAALRVYLEEVHGIHPSLVQTAGKETVVEISPAEPTQFALVLEGLADVDKKISVFKAVREITGLGLKETRELVESAPAIVKPNLPKDEAVALQKKLQSAGARSALVPASES